MAEAGAVRKLQIQSPRLLQRCQCTEKHPPHYVFDIDQCVDEVVLPDVHLARSMCWGRQIYRYLIGVLFIDYPHLVCIFY